MSCPFSMVLIVFALSVVLVIAVSPFAKLAVMVTLSVTVNVCVALDNSALLLQPVNL